MPDTTQKSCASPSSPGLPADPQAKCRTAKLISPFPRSTLSRFFDRGNHYEFLSLSQELAAPGELRQAQTFDFSFKNVEKQYESYQGINVKLRFVPHSPFPLSSLIIRRVTS
jgi:hypothetical protein